ncbi:MAG: L-histidine N(alpha)-methyltransferase [Bacteroidales bacterium]
MPYKNSTEVIEKTDILDLSPEQNQEEVKKEIIEGLFAENKSISSKFFYDAKGSALFEEITRLEEYYPTRSEKSILQSAGRSLIKEAAPLCITELGSGDPSKISILLSRLTARERSGITYRPVDISRTAVEDSLLRLHELFPELRTEGVIMDFTNQLQHMPEAEKNLYCFLGSTLGNFSRRQALQFLENLRENMKEHDFLILGLDQVKETDILERAYNDKTGITAAFNRNILSHLNRIIHATFRENDFEHLAFYNQEKERIEMHLKARHNIMVNSPYFPAPLRINKDEYIHTENSNKFTQQSGRELLKKAGFTQVNSFTDKYSWFDVLLLKPDKR